MVIGVTNSHAKTIVWMTKFYSLFSPELIIFNVSFCKCQSKVLKIIICILYVMKIHIIKNKKENRNNKIKLPQCGGSKDK